MAPSKLLEGDAFRDSSNTSPRATHGIPDGGLFSVYAEVEINVPPKVVYDTLLEVNHYKDWSTFIKDVTITKHPTSHAGNLKMQQGTCMTLKCQMTPEEQVVNREVCHYLEKLRQRGDGHDSHQKGGNITRMRWNLDNANLVTPGFIFKSEWTHEIEEQGDSTTLYRTWNVWAGLGAKLFRRKFEAALKERYQDWVRELAQRAEDVHAGRVSKGQLSKHSTTSTFTDATATTV